MGEVKLGDLKADSQKATTSNKAVTSDTSIEKQSPPAATANEPAKLNDISYQPHLGLARTLAKLDTKNISKCTSLYREVFTMAPSAHTAA